jgi:hypothetical protein
MGCEVTIEKRADNNNQNLPWQLPEESYLPVEDAKQISRIFAEVRSSHSLMTLLPDAGQVFEKCLLMNIEEGILHIDKPLDWNNHNGSLRVFFRDHQNCWRFFRTSNYTHNPFSLSVEIPETLFLLQRRRYKRVAVPHGTRAIVNTGRDPMTTVFVRDISASGMLFSDSTTTDEYPLDDSFQDIVISIPRAADSGSLAPARKVMPLISSGRVVRSFVDENTGRPCYGVSFEYESNYVREALCSLVQKVEPAA